MANSLSGNLKLGNVSATSLIKSAATVQKEVQTYNDTAAKIQWENSGYTDAAYQQYTSYLNGRISTLSTTGTITDLNKVQTLQQEIVTATHSNVSYQIQQENLSLMLAGDSGTSAGYAQKMQVVGQEFDRANSIGDTTLALSLQNQYASLSQSYNSALQTEQTAADTLAKSNAAASDAAQKAEIAATTAGFTDAKNAIHDSVVNLMANIKSGFTGKDGKPGDINTQLNNYRSQWNDAYKAITGQDLPKGSQLTIGSLVEASFTAKYNYDISAAQALQSSDPTSAAKFATFQNGQVVGGDALKIINNTDYYNVPGLGNINARDAYNIAHDPNAIREVTTLGPGGNAVTSFKWNATIGYTMGPDGLPMPLHSAEDKPPNLSKQTVNGVNSKVLTQQLIKAGFGDVKYDANTNSFTTKMTAQTEKWLNFHGANPDLSAGTGQLGAGNEITWTWDTKTNSLSAVTSGERLVHFATDTNGRAGVFQTTPQGQIAHIAGQYGFNNQVNSLVGGAQAEQNLRQKVSNQVHAMPSSTQALNPTKTFGQLPAPLAALHPTTGGLSLGGPSMVQRNGGGFNFTYQGQAISAARYAEVTNTPFRSLLQNMANKGDAGARSALGFVGNDFGYNPNKIGGSTGLYNSLTWGVKPSAKAPAAPVAGGRGLPF